MNTHAHTHTCWPEESGAKYLVKTYTTYTVINISEQDIIAMFYIAASRWDVYKMLICWHIMTKQSAAKMIPYHDRW